MSADKRNNIGKILKQRRGVIPLTLQELARASGVSLSYLYRIEKGERFPSARVLQKIAKPLSLGESELLTLAGFLSPETSALVENPSGRRLDPHVAAVLSQEPVEIQNTVITILSFLKSMAKAVDYGMDFAEYTHNKYPEVDEDIIAMGERYGE